MRRFGWRWWFEDRESGRIVIAQFPNWPLWTIAACWVARLVVDTGSTAYDALGWVIRGLWLVWGADEVVRGVNPWRRVLGASVIVWQIVAIASS